MSSNTIIVISGLIDATIKEYQPDVDFKIFRNVDGLDKYLEKTPIRATTLFFTKDIVAGVASTFSYIKDIVTMNDFLNVDKVVYITEEGSDEISSFNYLVEEFNLSNWEIVYGVLTRSFVQEVVNGTFRDDVYRENRKVVVRRPRADYVKEKLKNYDSLDEEYVDDDHDLMDIPDEEITEIPVEERSSTIEKLYIAGRSVKERTAFAVLSAQYISKTDRVLLVESDPDYHLLTEYVTKSKIDCLVITMTDLYEDVTRAIENIRKTESNLVVIECIDRIPFNYGYIESLLYYNLAADFRYIICESSIEELPHETNVTIVIPSTVTDVLATGELIDRSVVKYCRFVGVDMRDLPETHISSGVVMSKILNDILTVNNIICPVVTIPSLRLGDAAYDLGGILGKGVLS